MTSTAVRLDRNYYIAFGVSNGEIGRYAKAESPGEALDEAIKQQRRWNPDQSFDWWRVEPRDER